MYEICTKMASASSIEHLKQLLINYFSREGITSIALTYYKQHTKTGNKLIYDWVSAPLRAWHEHYLGENYADIDRTLESLEQGLLPTFWDLDCQLANAKNTREQRMRQESKEFGIHQGLCIPLHGPQGDFIVLVLHQRINEAGLHHWEQKQYGWLAIIQCYFHHLRQFLLQDAVSAVKLTRREQQCIQLTAENMRLDAIASLLGVSQRTVNFHLQNANKKLGVNNKYLAVIRWLARH
ncbi:helix-turn-helix transcriptional regulator [Legionella hackeliae]|uniref:Transcriptional regulator, LuxR family with an autoinducer-binding domain n=1 Tax=Legionella hackeliae TaxID=449 RepID=A0A0A8UNI6_LEGHA|nr:LuxR family transcriptional regulator [Legionella hackeliae]KTD08891.1 LuxR family transcriptional regulator [Legionella hackeliae]CEK10323.1 Transcriptional regulator, LuxR family with an autoinducer-binding domain [Legionella hackeliae]STX47052.1 LuxR family transcriptional regulator [Legionella hackeliae]